MVSYPLGTSFEYKEYTHFDSLQEKTLTGVKQATDIDQDDREVFIDFNTEKSGELKYKLKPLNSTRMEEIGPEGDHHKSILRIFIDTTSRNRFYRRFPKTREFLKNYIPSEDKSKAIYEFFRLHSIKGFTAPNLIASVYGYNVVSRELKRIESFAKERGYVTGMARDLCNYNEAGATGNLQLRIR